MVSAILSTLCVIPRLPGPLHFIFVYANTHARVHFRSITPTLSLHGALAAYTPQFSVIFETVGAGVELLAPVLARTTPLASRLYPR